jgi:hypothetical protein
MGSIRKALARAQQKSDEARRARLAGRPLPGLLEVNSAYPASMFPAPERSFTPEWLAHAARNAAEGLQRPPLPERVTLDPDDFPAHKALVAALGMGEPRRAPRAWLEGAAREVAEERRRVASQADIASCVGTDDPVLFLDFDGVLNSTAYFRKRGEAPEGMPWTHHDIDPEAVARLNRVVRETGCVIVVSSTWRLIHSLADLRGILNARGFEGKIVGRTTRLEEWGRQVYRADEIKEWLASRNEHGHAPKAFAIVDDDYDAGVGLATHFAQTNVEIGLTDADADRLIAILTPIDEAP